MIFNLVLSFAQVDGDSLLGLTGIDNKGVCFEQKEFYTRPTKYTFPPETCA